MTRWPYFPHRPLLFFPHRPWQRPSAPGRVRIPRARWGARRARTWGCWA